MSQSQPPPAGAVSAPVRARALRLSWLGCALAGLWLPACRCSGSEPDQGPEAGDNLAGCRSACAAYSQAKCPRREGHGAYLECVEQCASALASSERAQCGKLRDAYHTCVARSAIDCPAVNSELGVALEQGEGVQACAGELASLDRCTAACRNEGSTHLGEGSVAGKLVKAELTRSGCTDCLQATRGGAPPGSPCSAASVCQEHCCTCSTGAARYRARACVDGACAPSDLACSVTPAAVLHSPCSQ